MMRMNWYVRVTMKGGKTDYITVKANSKRDAIYAALDAFPDAVRAAVLRHD